MDPETTLIVFGAAGLVVNKILGPTADYIGVGVQSFAEHRVENLKKIFAKAEQRLGDRIYEPGSVSPRVLGRILDEGSFASDAIAIEYLGGILASSRTRVARDDRGAAMIALVSRLSTYQLRAHYIMYGTIHTLYGDGRPFEFGINQRRRELRTFIPEDELSSALDLGEDETPHILIPHIIAGLVNERLIDGDFAWGSDKDIHLYGVRERGRGLVFVPSVQGVQFFLWAHGMPNSELQHILAPDSAFSTHPDIRMPSDAVSVTALLAKVRRPLMRRRPKR
jgi:hypothetical protein